MVVLEQPSREWRPVQNIAALTFNPLIPHRMSDVGKYGIAERSLCEKNLRNGSVTFPKSHCRYLCGFWRGSRECSSRRAWQTKEKAGMLTSGVPVDVCPAGSRKDASRPMIHSRHQLKVQRSSLEPWLTSPSPLSRQPCLSAKQGFRTNNLSK